jgi:hypothetical protein
MTTGTRPVLLVGSINLATRDDALDAASRHLRDDLCAVPDGETGDRSIWVAWSLDRLREDPALVVTQEIVFESPTLATASVPMFGLADGAVADAITFGPLGYADEAKASYEAFCNLRESGCFQPGTRFQVSLPTAMMFAICCQDARRDVLRAFERALVGEITALLEHIPAEDIAIQWDVAGEVQHEEQRRVDGAEDSEWPFVEATESIARVSQEIPETALVGVHLCYGDPDGHHVIEPRDLGVCVDMANSVGELMRRRLDWIHMPIPIERDDAAYFAPLAWLTLPADTELYLGLLHKEDGLDGAKRRMAAASIHRQDFGVATECGLGREPTDAIDELLALHHEAARIAY